MAVLRFQWALGYKGAHIPDAWQHHPRARINLPPHALVFLGSRSSGPNQESRRGTFDVSVDLALRVQVVQALQNLPQDCGNVGLLQGARFQLCIDRTAGLRLPPARPICPSFHTTRLSRRPRLNLQGRVTLCTVGLPTPLATLEIK